MDDPTQESARFVAESDTNRSSRRARWQAESLDEETRALLEEDAKYFIHQAASTPCLNALRHCEGIYLEDLQGRRYMDFHGNGVHQVGFGNPAVIDAIKAQLDDLSFCTRRYTNYPAVQLAKRLTDLAPGDLSRVLFAPGGTNVVSIALTLTRLATGRHKIISIWDSYHGSTLDAVSAGGEAEFRSGVGPLLPGTEHVPSPNAYRCLWDCSARGGCDLKCAQYIEYILEKEQDIAAVIAEPIRGGVYIPTPEFWQAVRRACTKHKALLIFDEIPHALGRTGTMFTCDNFGVVPDILLIGKGLGGGILPLAAMIAREDLNIAAEREVGHYTHEKNPVACAAALATLRYIDDNRLIEHARELGAYALGRLKDMMQRHPLIGDVRGLGLVMGIELVRDRKTKEPARAQAEQIMYAALSRGLSFKLTMGNIIALTPPLIVTREELDRALDIIETCIQDLE